MLARLTQKGHAKSDFTPSKGTLACLKNDIQSPTAHQQKRRWYVPLKSDIKSPTSQNQKGRWHVSLKNDIQSPTSNPLYICIHICTYATLLHATIINNALCKKKCGMYILIPITC